MTNCERCGGTGTITTKEQTFWNNEEGYIMADITRICRACDNWGKSSR